MSKELHRKISEKATKFIMRHFNCPIGIVESTAAQSEFLDGYAANYHSSYIVEAKTSRKDFKRDFLKPFRADTARAVGNYRFYACPQGLIQPADLPPKWGLIWVDERGCCKLQGYPDPRGFESPYSPNRFDDTDRYKERQVLFYLAKRFAERRFMNNVFAE